MKIAVIGTGIAGNVAAHYLARENEVTVYESAGRIGGHTNTVNVDVAGRTYAVDTGFIVFNQRTYPRFIELIDALGVGWQDSEMSFSVQDENSGLEYNGTSLNALFAQRRNLFRPAFHRMIRDILRFNRRALALLKPDAPDFPLGDYLEREGYGREFIEQFIVPMGAAIWSARPTAMLRMPARFFVRFFDNHGLLSVKDRPVWRVIKGGSSQYVTRLIAGHRERIRLNTPVESVRRFADRVEIEASGCGTESFDHVFVACHSDQALELLADPSPEEVSVLGAIKYQSNEAVLHTDDRLMPRRKLAWAAWNYHILRQQQERVAVTYNMNILQGLDAPVQFCVTLNNTEAIDPDRIISTHHYEHPVFTPEAVDAQQQHQTLNGRRRTWYCGAYWRNGFHEDGVVSALEAIAHFNNEPIHEQRDFYRTG